MYTNLCSIMTFEDTSLDIKPIIHDAGDATPQEIELADEIDNITQIDGADESLLSYCRDARQFTLEPTGLVEGGVLAIEEIDVNTGVLRTAMDLNYFDTI